MFKSRWLKQPARVANATRVRRNSVLAKRFPDTRDVCRLRQKSERFPAKCEQIGQVFA